MSKFETKFVATNTAFQVEGYEKIEYDLLFVEGVFSTENSELADNYQKFGRCLMIDAGLGIQVYLNEGKPELEELLAGSV